MLFSSLPLPSYICRTQQQSPSLPPAVLRVFFSFLNRTRLQSRSSVSLSGVRSCSQAGALLFRVPLPASYAVTITISASSSPLSSPFLYPLYRAAATIISALALLCPCPGVLHRTWLQPRLSTPLFSVVCHLFFFKGVCRGMLIVRAVQARVCRTSRPPVSKVHGHADRKVGVRSVSGLSSVRAGLCCLHLWGAVEGSDSDVTTSASRGSRCVPGSAHGSPRHLS